MEGNVAMASGMADGMGQSYDRLEARVLKKPA